MAEYIERDAALRELELEAEIAEGARCGAVKLPVASRHYALGRRDCANVVLDRIRQVPSADVEPVRHGRWIADKFGNLWCSSCKHCGSNDGIDTDFCPNCGAKMDGEVE